MERNDLKAHNDMDDNLTENKIKMCTSSQNVFIERVGIYKDMCTEKKNISKN